MGSLIDYLFSPPSMPAIPFPPHVSEGIVDVVREAYRLVYLRGVYDGFVAGALLILILLPCRRDR